MLTFHYTHRVKLTLEKSPVAHSSYKNHNLANICHKICMMQHFNGKGMFYYNKMIISKEQKKIMGVFLSEIELKQSKINKHFILLPDNDGLDDYNVALLVC